MLTITTRSGSRYLVGDDDTVTRLSEVPVQGFDGQLVDEPMISWEFPVVGLPWRYRTADGPFVTTTVVAVWHSVIPLHQARDAIFGPQAHIVTVPN